MLSHRFAGPLERVEEDLDKILEGDYSVRFKVREKDDIKNIVNKLNRLLEKFKSS
ncbi:MAG: methyl-accepting chemotaxis protein [Candidatus Omnitrophica bacterium]|nr:methyl-accepting chemotaxis protein [Candidatus Omnitrophota bacterium]